MVILNTVLHIASSSLILNGNTLAGARVAQSATITFPINLFLFVSLFVYLSKLFLKIFNHRISIIKGFSKSHDQGMHANMQIVAKKVTLGLLLSLFLYLFLFLTGSFCSQVRSNIFVSITILSLQVVYHVLLSAYSEFFSNIPFSKAMTVIFTALVPSITLAHMCLMLTVDIRRLRMKLGSTLGSNSEMSEVR